MAIAFFKVIAFVCASKVVDASFKQSFGRKFGSSAQLQECLSSLMS